MLDYVRAALLLTTSCAALLLGNSRVQVHPSATAIDPGVCSHTATEHYLPTSESLAEHSLPGWFKDAKLGIFIHWGLYSVPAFAPLKTTFEDRKKYNKSDDYMHVNPYAEWYFNTMLYNDSETARIHRMRYGEEPSARSYFEQFVPRFNNAVKHWTPATWAKIFRKARAKYVVLTTKHHDGFCLWPTNVVNPHRPQWSQHAERDIVGELTAAVRAEGLEMGLYYSGGYDWSFHKGDFHVPGWKEFITDPNYTNLAHSHLTELINTYKPSILWDDIGWPRTAKEWANKSSPERLLETFADYFNNRCPEGVVNQRWDAKGEFLGDFGTPEYKYFGEVQASSFEECRGIGNSFGYNAEEGASEYMTPEAAIKLLIDIAAQNGRLLLDVGPTADGIIPELQLKVLQGIGDWMEVNGEALEGTLPLLKPGSKLDDKPFRVRYMQKPPHVYAIIMNREGCRSFELHKSLMDTMTIKTAVVLAEGNTHSLQFSTHCNRTSTTGYSSRCPGNWVVPTLPNQLDIELPIVLRFELNRNDPIFNVTRYFQ